MSSVLRNYSFPYCLKLGLFIRTDLIRNRMLCVNAQKIVCNIAIVFTKLIMSKVGLLRIQMNHNPQISVGQSLGKYKLQARVSVQLLYIIKRVSLLA